MVLLLDQAGPRCRSLRKQESVVCVLLIQELALAIELVRSSSKLGKAAWLSFY
jgi:hypothetical protein